MTGLIAYLWQQSSLDLRMMNINNNNIMSDINNNNNKTRNKLMCVLCHVPLYKMEEEGIQFRCSKCRKVYQLYYEVMAYESDFETIYNEEEDSLELEGLEGSQSSPALVVADNDNVFDDDDEYNDNNPTTRSDITIPKYMKNSDTVKVVEFKEIIEED